MVLNLKIEIYFNHVPGGADERCKKRSDFSPFSEYLTIKKQNIV